MSATRRSIVRWRERPSLRERVDQARREIERARAELGQTAGDAKEASLLTVTRLVRAWKAWAERPVTRPVPAEALPAQVSFAPANRGFSRPTNRPVSAPQAQMAQSFRPRPVESPVTLAAAQRLFSKQAQGTNPSRSTSQAMYRPTAAPAASPRRSASQSRQEEKETTTMPAYKPLSTILRRISPRKDAAASTPPARRRTSSDLILIAGGVGLTLTCAFFPWYVFFNQEQFGIKAMRFNGARDTGPIPAGATPAGDRIIKDSDAPVRDIAEFPVDSFTTGTLAAQDDQPPPGLDEQPFPGDAAPSDDFRVVHVANGRALIEDDRGLWIVERGAVLPDNARVQSIEQRGGRWVVVTDSRTLEVQP